MRVRKILGLFFSHSMMFFCGDVTHLDLCDAAQAVASFTGFVLTRTKALDLFSWTKLNVVFFFFLTKATILIRLSAFAPAARVT